MHIMHAQTRRQREVLDFITRYIDSHGYRPSYQVVARHMGVNSRAGIARIVHDLESQALLSICRGYGALYVAIGYSSGPTESWGAALIDWIDTPSANDGALDSAPFPLPALMLIGYYPSRVSAFRVTCHALAD